MARRLSRKIRSREEWERARARGHDRWILRQGVLGFGLPIHVLTLLALDLFGSFPGEIDASWWMKMLFALAFAALGGYVVADREWHGAKDRFGGRKSGEPGR